MNARHELVTESKLSTRKFSLPRFQRNILLWAVSLTIGLFAWTFLAWWFGPSTIASPWATMTAARELAENGRLWESVGISLQRIFSGWGLGVLVGAPIGIVMGRFRLIRELFDPYIEFLRFIPPTAFVTLSVIWFGIGETSKVVLIFYASVFTVTLSTIAAVLAVPKNRLDAATNLGANPFQVMYTVLLPSAIPGIVTGSRLAMGNSFLTIVVAEIVAADSGLGALIWQSRNYGRIDWTFVAIISMGVLGFAFDRILRLSTSSLLGRYGVMH